MLGAMSGDRVVGVVQRLARYPVKSLRGEWCTSVMVEPAGLAHDRSYAVYGDDGRIASGKTTRRFRRMDNLLTMRSWMDAGSLWVELPDGRVYRIGDPRLEPAVSEVVGEPVTVRAEDSIRHKDDMPVHLITTGSLGWVADLRPGFDGAAERFRPNIVVEVDAPGRVEESWLGSTLRIGDCRLRVAKRVERCVMVTQAQEGLRFLPSLLPVLTAEAEMCLGIYAKVENRGRLSQGDRVILEDRSTPPDGQAPSAP
ncbi:MAG: MOSC domain-containing protein [Acidimicrobiales bacterium]